MMKTKGMLYCRSISL